MNQVRRRVLVVEDAPLVAMLIEDMLLDLGHDVVGPAFRVRTAIPLARAAAIDFAILDVNVGDENSFPVAAVLRGRGIPFMFATGYGKRGLTGEFAAVPTLDKPFDLGRLEALLAQLAR